MQRERPKRGGVMVMAKRAIALVSVMVVLFLLSAMVAVVGISVSGNLRNNQVADLKRVARYAAYAGSQRALLDIKNHPTYKTFPAYVNQTLPNDPNSSYSVNITSNLNYLPWNAKVIYAPDGTEVPPGLVYIQSVGTSQQMALTGDSVLATMGKTGTVNWDRAARLTTFIYTPDSGHVDQIDTSTKLIVPPPSPPPELVTITENGDKSAVMANTSYIAGGLEIPYQAPFATAIDNTTTGNPAFLPGPLPDNSRPRNSVPKFGLDSSLHTYGYWAPAPLTLSPGATYSELTYNLASSPSNVVNIPGGLYYITGNISLNGVNVTTGANAIIYVGGDVKLTNCTVNWEQGAAPFYRPLQCQFYFPYDRMATNRRFGAANVSAAMVIGGKQLDVGLSQSQMVGAVMADSLSLLGNSTLDYDGGLTASPVQSVMLVDVCGQKSDRDTRSNFSTAGCFVATAAYGDVDAPEVVELRRFRDNVMLQSGPGRLLVQTYYLLSPPLARFIATSDILRLAARVALAPIVWAVSHFHLACALLCTLLMLLALTWRLWAQLAYYGLTGRKLGA